jgi:DNA polymerase-1
MDGTLAFARAERQGIRIDVPYVQQKKEEITDKIEELENTIHTTSFYRRWQHSRSGKTPNIYSNQQLASYLYGVLKIDPVVITKSGKGATDEEALSQLNIPELNQLLQIRKLKKVRDTYLDGFEREAVNGYIHPNFNLHLVRTFRSSSSDPNFQNIPKRDKESMKICRQALYPRPGHLLLEADYSSLEVRISSCYNQDPKLVQYVTDPTTDMHRDMAQQIFLLDDYDGTNSEHKVLRFTAKNGFVFPQFYGDWYKTCALYMIGLTHLPKEGKWKKGQGTPFGDGTLSDHLIAKGITSTDAFINHVKRIEQDFWEVRFPVYSKWKDRWYGKYLRTGYVDLKTGFRCYGPMSRNDVINYPVQGAAFHCLLKSFILMDEIIEREKWDTKLVGQIHDSMILDVLPNELEKVVKTIQEVTCERLKKEWGWITVPLSVGIDVSEVDGSWAKTKNYV